MNDFRYSLFFSIQTILCSTNFIIIKAPGDGERGNQIGKSKNLIQHKSIKIKVINMQKCRHSEEVYKIFDQ